MTSVSSLAQSWLHAVNTQDIDRLLELSAPDIALIGPRGRASGHQVLRDWVAQAGLTLTTQRIFQRGDSVVLAQQGVWQSEATGGVPSEAEVASRFRVNSQQVIEYERYDTLAQALEAAGMAEADEQEVIT